MRDRGREGGRDGGRERGMAEGGRGWREEQEGREGGRGFCSLCKLFLKAPLVYKSIFFLIHCV